MSDDLDGSDADQTVRFSLGPIEYEIDLSSDNADAMRDALRPYVAAARRISGKAGIIPRRTVPGRPPSSITADKEHAKAERALLRDWAERHGIHVNERGRIPDAVVAAFKADTPEAVGGKRPEPAKAVAKAVAVPKPADPKKAVNGKPPAKKVAAANGSANGSRTVTRRSSVKAIPPAVFQG
jgi:hypothetical protein